MPKKRLLIIEDDVDVAEMLNVYFVSQGYEVFSAPSGNEGVAMARAKSPNLILLDVMLPDMDGFDVCKLLRTTALTRYIPIIFLTQRDRRADKVAGLELGADDYITKPFDMEELRLRVRGSLRRSSREHLQDPHTGLPTATVIEEAQRALQQRSGWTQLDIHLTGLDEFREVYGFVAADEVLAFAGQCLAETIAALGTGEDFAGTQAENQFVVFTFASDVKAFSEALIARFRDGARKFYSFIDCALGYITLYDGPNGERRVPLMGFSVNEVIRTPGSP